MSAQDRIRRARTHALAEWNDRSRINLTNVKTIVVGKRFETLKQS